MSAMLLIPERKFQLTNLSRKSTFQFLGFLLCYVIVSYPLGIEGLEILIYMCIPCPSYLRYLSLLYFPMVNLLLKIFDMKKVF